MKPIVKLVSLWWLPLLLGVAACQPKPSVIGQKLGKPYVIDGKTYYPEYDPTYDKIGVGSWYGPGFHGKYTASGEIFNQNDLTAAHPTLPMPSLVRVTNLANGKSVIVRINDRGPFKANRIIDLSKKSAQTIGMRSTSQVRVQFLKQETEEMVASLQSGAKKIDMASLNAAVANSRDASVIASTQPSEQIVESTVASTHAGQIVSPAAPIITVKSGDLDQPKTAKKDIAAPDNDNGERLAAYQPKGANNTQPKSASVDGGQVSTIKEVKLVREPVSEVVAAQDEAPPARKLASQVNGFYVQAGSFAAEENAHRLSSKLEGIGLIAVGKVEMGDKTWWRVRLGPFASQDDAAEALNKVHAVGVTDARVVHL